MRQVWKRLTYANVMSSLALFLVLGGGAAVAAGHLGKNSVGTKQLKRNSVTAAKIKQNSVGAPKILNGAVTAGKLGSASVSGAALVDGSVSGPKIATSAVSEGKLAPDAVSESKLAPGAVTGSKLASGAVTNEKLANGAVSGSKIDLASLGTVPSAAVAQSLATTTPLKLTRVASSATANTEEVAAAAATPVVIYDDSHFTVYGKCFIADDGEEGTELNSVVYIATKQDGAIFDGDNDELSGRTPGYLDVASPENRREVISDSAEPNSANMQYEGDTEFGATAADGYTIQGVNQVAEKFGNPTAGNGPYGPGDVCLFSGYVIHS